MHLRADLEDHDVSPRTLISLVPFQVAKPSEIRWAWPPGIVAQSPVMEGQSLRLNASCKSITQHPAGNGHI